MDKIFYLKNIIILKVQNPTIVCSLYSFHKLVCDKRVHNQVFYQNLDHLWADECAIEILQIDFFTKLTKLEVVDLSYNHISEIPEFDDDFVIEIDPQIIDGEKIYFHKDK